MPTVITHKRGATFTRVAYLPPVFADGYFAGWTVAAHMRTRTGQLVAPLACTWLDGATTRALELRCDDTAAWPVDVLEFDVKLTRPDGFDILSNTAQCRVTRAQTLTGGTP